MRAADSLFPSLAYGCLIVAAVALIFLCMAKQPTDALGVLLSFILLTFVSLCLFGYGRHTGRRFRGWSPTTRDEGGIRLNYHRGHRRDVRCPEHKLL